MKYLPLVLVLTGCAGLILQPEDSVGMKTSKLLGRTGLIIVSMGMSEITMEELKKEQWGGPTGAHEAGRRDQCEVRSSRW